MCLVKKRQQVLMDGGGEKRQARHTNTRGKSRVSVYLLGCRGWYRDDDDGDDGSESEAILKGRKAGRYFFFFLLSRDRRGKRARLRCLRLP